MTATVSTRPGAGADQQRRDERQHGAFQLDRAGSNAYQRSGPARSFLDGARKHMEREPESEIEDGADDRRGDRREPARERWFARSRSMNGAPAK